MPSPRLHPPHLPKIYRRKKMSVVVETRARLSSIFALRRLESRKQPDSGYDTSTTSNCWYISMTMGVIQEASGYQLSSFTAPPKTAAETLSEKNPRDTPPTHTNTHKSCSTHSSTPVHVPAACLTKQLPWHPQTFKFTKFTPYPSPDRVHRHSGGVADTKKWWKWKLNQEWRRVRVQRREGRQGGSNHHALRRANQYELNLLASLTLVIVPWNNEIAFKVKHDRHNNYCCSRSWREREGNKHGM